MVRIPDIAPRSFGTFVKDDPGDHRRHRSSCAWTSLSKRRLKAPFRQTIQPHRIPLPSIRNAPGDGLEGDTLNNNAVALPQRRHMLPRMRAPASLMSELAARSVAIPTPGAREVPRTCLSCRFG